MGKYSGSCSSGSSSRSGSPVSPKASPVPEILVDHLSRNVNEAHLKEIFCNFGDVVNLPKGFGYVEFKTKADAEKAQIYMDGAQIDGMIVGVKFTLHERKRVSPPPKVVSAAPKRDLPKPDIAGADKDGQKRLREPSPQGKPSSPLRRKSPIARKGGSPSPPRRRMVSPVRRQGQSPYRRGETPPRRRPLSPGRRSPSPVRRNRSPARSPRRMRGSPVRRRSPIPARRR